MIKRLKLGCLTLASNKDIERSGTRKALTAFFSTAKKTLSVGISLTDWN